MSTIDLQRDLMGSGLAPQLAGLLARQLLGITATIEAGGAADQLSAGWSVTPKNANYTLAATDLCKVLSHTNGTAYAWFVPANADVAIGAGTGIVIDNSAGTAPLTIMPGTGVILLRLSGVGGNGPQVLRAGSKAILLKVDDNLWDMA
jgi:hypothetical protein